MEIDPETTSGFFNCFVEGEDERPTRGGKIINFMADCKYCNTSDEEDWDTIVPFGPKGGIKSPYGYLNPKPLVLVTREEWGAVPPREARPVPGGYPITSVVIDMGSDKATACFDRQECEQRMRNLQQYYMEVMDLPDIPYNFFVGHDGTIYEARGWYAAPSPSINSYTDIQERRMDIAFIGDYRRKLWPSVMTNAIYDLVNDGVNRGLADTFCKFVDHRDGVSDKL